MKKNIKMLIILSLYMLVTFVFSGIYAASASISANKTSVTAGTTVKVTVKYSAAAWNLNISGAANDSIVGYDSDGKNTSGSKSYTINTNKAGTYTVTLSGDVTDGNTDENKNVSGSVTITVKAKQTTTSNNTTSSSSNNSSTNTTSGKTSNTTKTNTTTKSSNANISKLNINVEGFSFNSTDTTYNVNVSENVNKLAIGVTLASSKATYTIYGNKDFKVGNNVVRIVVTAENGTTKTYRINVNKSGNIEESSADLSNLIIEDMTFDNKFSSETTEYVGSKVLFKDKLNILVYTVADEATYKIVGNENLKEGENTIKIIVTSKDKSNTKEYTVKFEMVSKEETNALEVISIYGEQERPINSNSKYSSTNDTWSILKENSTIILLYLLALVEFAQVIYLYVQLKSVNPDAITVRRRNKNK